MKNAATIRNNNLKNDILENVEDTKTFHFDLGKEISSQLSLAIHGLQETISTGISILKKYCIMNIPQFLSTKRNFST
jgi:hypothetical protein